MDNRKIEEVRELLNTMVASESYTQKELLEVSKKLDSLILQHINEKKKSSGNSGEHKQI